MYDLIAVGDATLDVFLQLGTANVSCDLDSHACKLSLNYADKIAVESATFIIGGNAANAAVGARRLGFTSALLTTIGEDETGHKIRSVLQREGVSTEHLSVAPDQPSNYSVVLNVGAERTILVHHVPRTYTWNIQQPPRWYYLTSMGAGFEPVYDHVVQSICTAGCSMAYNPGTHQLHKGRDFLAPSLAATTILFLNREEAATLLAVPLQTGMKTLLTELHRLGPRIVVITDGPQGAYASDGTDMLFLPVFNGPVVERTGCGDSFGVAFTAAIMEGKTLCEAMQWGNANATSVVSYIGPQTGLLNQSAILALIEQNRSIQPIVL